MLRAGKRKVQRTWLFWNTWVFLGITAYACKDLINNFLLLGWHFHTGQFLVSWAELRTLLNCLPGSIYWSLGNKQHAEVKLWNHTWLQRLLSCSLAVLLAASVSPSISVDLWGYCEN